MKWIAYRMTEGKTHRWFRYTVTLALPHSWIETWAHHEVKKGMNKCKCIKCWAVHRVMKQWEME